MLSETGSGVTKTHVVVLSVVVLVASASAAVNVRDPMNVFGDLKIAGGEVSAEDQNQNPANITLTSPINMQNNNIYNIGNLNTGNGGGGGGGELKTFGYSNVATDSTSGFETIRTETFNPDKGVSVLGGYAEVTQDISYGDEPARARIRVTYEDGSEKTFESVGIKVSPNDPGYTGDPPAPIYPSDTLKQPAVTEIHFEYKGSRSGGSDDEDRAKFRIDLIQGGTDGGGGSLSGSPVFGSVSYTKMGETSEFLTDRYDYEDVKTLSSGESVSVSRTAQLGGTTKFRVLGGIVNRDTDGPPPSGRHFGDAIQRDLGYVQLLVDGEVVSEVQELNEWSAGTRMAGTLWIGTVNNRRKPVMTTDPISVEAGDTVTARLVSDQEVDTDEVGSGGVGSFYQYVVLKRVDK